VNTTTLLLDNWREWMYAMESGDTDNGPTLEEMREEFEWVDEQWVESCNEGENRK